MVPVLFQVQQQTVTGIQYLALEHEWQHILHVKFPADNQQHFSLGQLNDDVSAALKIDKVFLGCRIIIYLADFCAQVTLSNYLLDWILL